MRYQRDRNGDCRTTFARMLHRLWSRYLGGLGPNSCPTPILREDVSLLERWTIQLGRYWPMFQRRPHDPGSKIVRNVGQYLPENTVQHFRRHIHTRQMSPTESEGEPCISLASLKDTGLRENSPVFRANSKTHYPSFVYMPTKSRSKIPYHGTEFTRKGCPFPWL